MITSLNSDYSVIHPRLIFTCFVRTTIVTHYNKRQSTYRQSGTNQTNYLYRTAGSTSDVTVTAANVATATTSTDGMVGGVVDDGVLCRVLVQTGDVGVVDHADHGHAQVDAQRVQVNEAKERHDGQGQPRRAP